MSKTSSEKIKKMFEMLDKGSSVNEISIQLGMGKTTIRDNMKSAGYIKPTNKPKSEIPFWYISKNEQEAINKRRGELMVQMINEGIIDEDTIRATAKPNELTDEEVKQKMREFTESMLRHAKELKGEK